jgi:phytoene dehydrogenase-like protein
LTTPAAALAASRWDVVVVGAGHNGLAAAAYLARAGLGVAVAERRDRVGGACTLEQPFSDPGWQVSPCAYLVGLLHPLVIDELGLPARGYRVQVVDPHLWCPFTDGTSLALWEDPAKAARAVAELSPRDVEGYLAYSELFARIRRTLREGDRDTWVGEAPDQEAIRERFGRDREAVEVLFDEPIASVLERYMADPRLHTALHGQGLIGTFAGPKEPGTAAIHALHSMGQVAGVRGAWGYVEGGMGRISVLLAEAAEAEGVAIAVGAEVTAIHPGEGIEVEGVGMVAAPVVVSGADPVRTAALAGPGLSAPFAERVGRWRTTSPVLKINCALSRLPTFAQAGEGVEPHRAMVTVSTGVDDSQAACAAARRGVPSPAWCELYFHSAYDPSVAPPGRHAMSVFAQFVPYQLAEGTWEGRRDEIADSALAAIARFAPDVTDCILERQVLGPPDVEARIGLTGGHIFQGECLPDQMWDRRFAPRTGIPGLYLCGAATHPGGSVIGVNGRNAAMAVLEDLERLGRPG